MAHRIHIFGASASGTSTLGAHLAQVIGGLHLDTDSYYWHQTDPPFTQKRNPAERVSMIEREILGMPNWVLSGSICSWGDPLLRLDLWGELERQIRAHAQSGDVALGTASEYGQKYVVRGELQGPTGRTAQILTVWILRRGDTVPRFVTAYPGGQTCRTACSIQ